MEGVWSFAKCTTRSKHSNQDSCNRLWDLATTWQHRAASSVAPDFLLRNSNSASLWMARLAHWIRVSSVTAGPLARRGAFVISHGRKVLSEQLYKVLKDYFWVVSRWQYTMYSTVTWMLVYDTNFRSPVPRAKFRCTEQTFQWNWLINLCVFLSQCSLRDCEIVAIRDAY